MQNTITERISVLIEIMGENANSFSKKIGVSQSTVATALKRNKGVNSELLEKILIAFPLINNEWLITGEGEMLKNEDVKQETTIKANENEFLTYLKKQVEELKEQNDRLREENGYYKGLLETNSIHYKQTGT